MSKYEIDGLKKQLRESQGHLTDLGNEIERVKTAINLELESLIKTKHLLVSKYYELEDLAINIGNVAGDSSPPIGSERKKP